MRQRIYPLPRIEMLSVADIREERPVALVTSGPAWEALDGALRLPQVWRAEPSDASLATFEEIAREIPDEARVIYAVGGGLAMDAAKLAAQRRGLPLVGVPTALSADAPLTPASGIRQDGCVVYLETAPPELLYVDWDLLARAPSWMRAAGICDLLSIASGVWDWRFAEERGRNTPDEAWMPYAAALARAILDEGLGCAASAGRGEVSGLRRLLELLALEVQLCNLIGHSRPEEGSEHYFAYAVEQWLGPGLPHGDLVGPGILAIAAAQGQDIAPLRRALLDAGVRLGRIPRDAAEQTLRGLPDYVQRHHLPFGVGHVLDQDRVAAALRSLWE
jgi:glycerol-1-phosphate dehydrogenase [NAD(P)+]